jgi:hypothetical protein
MAGGFPKLVASRQNHFGGLHALDRTRAMMMQPDQIEQWPLARLKPYARNGRTKMPIR